MRGTRVICTDPDNDTRKLRDEDAFSVAIPPHTQPRLRLATRLWTGVSLVAACAPLESRATCRIEEDLVQMRMQRECLVTEQQQQQPYADRCRAETPLPFGDGVGAVPDSPTTLMDSNSHSPQYMSPLPTMSEHQHEALAREASSRNASSGKCVLLARSRSIGRRLRGSISSAFARPAFAKHPSASGFEGLARWSMAPPSLPWFNERIGLDAPIKHSADDRVVLHVMHSPASSPASVPSTSTDPSDAFDNQGSAK